MHPEQALVAKARRRVRKAVDNPDEHVARVHRVDENTFEYKVKHHVRSIFFKLDSLGRLRKQK